MKHVPRSSLLLILALLAACFRATPPAPPPEAFPVEIPASPEAPPHPPEMGEEEAPAPEALPPPPETEDEEALQEKAYTADLSPPLPRLTERTILKPFGMFITRETSPTKPERFRGFHVGTDFEVFPEERAGGEVRVSALCGGTLRLKKWAQGYGGVAVQECLLQGEPVTVLYGHLALRSIEADVGEELASGAFLGFLGEEGSPETDGERKHLHLAVHRGKELTLLGYVQSMEKLAGWIDPMELID